MGHVLRHQIIVIFGAPDFEERAARNLLRGEGILTGTATYRGEPCNSKNAYLADGFISDNESKSLVGREAILFECGPGASGKLPIRILCDHHNPGDPGFEFSAQNYWPGSSIGQLCIFLGVKPSKHLRLVAAADHCPAEACQGLCPGMDKKEIADFRLEQKLQFYRLYPEKFPHKQTREDLEAVIAKAEEKLRSAPRLQGFCDMRGMDFVDEISEAAIRSGLAYLSSTIDTSSPVRLKKIKVGGYATSLMVESFMLWAKDLPGAQDVYGVSKRGFAGAYVAL